MDIRELQAFVAVAETRSVSQAAENIHLTQPAVSKRIASLENELGTLLFDRISRQLLITEAGQQFLPIARKVLQSVDDGKKLIQNMSGQIGGSLQLGTSHHIGLHRLPPILREYTQRFGDVKLELHFNDSELVIEKILHGELDIGVVTLPDRDIQTLSRIPLWKDELVFVIGKDIPIKSRITPEDLAEMRSILPEQGTITREVLEQALNEYKVTLKQTLSTNFLETIKMMVSVGLGWSVLPRTMLSADLVEFKVRGVRLHRQLGIVYDRRRTLPNSVIALQEILLKHQGQ